MTTPPSPGPGARLSGGYARLVVRFRFLVIGGWLAVALGAFLLPSGSSSGGGLDGFVAADNRVVATEVRSFELFGFPR